jgi:hypothetical protein
MSAPKRVSDTKVREAIVSWKGNVDAAASALGIARCNLYKRFEGAGIAPADLESLRKGGTLAAASDSSKAASPPPSFPVRVTNRPPKFRVPPVVAERIRQGRFQLRARYNVDFADSDVLAAFIEDGFAEWLKGKLP